MSDNLVILGTTYSNAAGFKATDDQDNVLTFTTGGGGSAVLGTKNISANGTYSAQDDNYDEYSEVTVNVPTGTPRTSSDLTVSGATVTAPAGLYSSSASASVASGTEGTPTATKGTVSNHSVSVTPSVTNTTGYITGDTKTGTAVTVSASELVSGNRSIVDNGTNIDVTNYATVSVAVPFSAITVSTSSPSGGNNGDVWIKTS